jgi:hypothetical protein
MAQAAMAMVPECCKVRHVLAEKFATAARLFAEAVVLLVDHKGNASHHEYSRLHAAALKAQLRAEEARVAFEEHVSSHQCGEADA